MKERAIELLNSICYELTDEQFRKLVKTINEIEEIINELDNEVNKLEGRY